MTEEAEVSQLVDSVGPDFPSRYSNRCPWCGERWAPGDLLAYVDFPGEKPKVHCRACADIFRGWLGGERVVGRWEKEQIARKRRDERRRERLEAEERERARLRSALGLVCPRCGAGPGEKCRATSGKEASGPHAPRLHEVDALERRGVLRLVRTDEGEG